MSSLPPTSRRARSFLAATAAQSWRSSSAIRSSSGSLPRKRKTGASDVRIGVLCSRIRAEEKLLFESLDRKSTRLNSSHLGISYAVFCLKKKIKEVNHRCDSQDVERVSIDHR